VQYLMERLVNRADPAMGLAPPFDLAEAVAAQLQRIVMNRPDVAASGVHLDDFGMPAIVEQGRGLKDLEAYGARLARAIARYEPRLRDVTVEWLASGRALSPRNLVVRGRLVDGVELHAFRFDMPTGGAR
jgi:predicted component of type VI protein secretion system